MILLVPPPISVLPHELRLYLVKKNGEAVQILSMEVRPLSLRSWDRILMYLNLNVKVNYRIRKKDSMQR